MITRQAQHKDYLQILQLQSANTPEHLTAEQRQQGFIVSQMDEAQLDAINSGLGIWVACEGDKVGGFICLNTIDQLPRPGIVEAMLKELPHARFNGRSLSTQRLFLYGPVCLDSAFRGKGLLRQLYAAVKQHTQDDFEVGIAFINDRNVHSLNVHIKGLGMQDVLTFTYQNESYHLMAFSPCDPM